MRAFKMTGLGCAAAILLLVVACGQRREQQTEQTDAGPGEDAGEGPCPGVPEADRAKLVAQVGDTNITVCDVTDALNKMSPYLRKAYEAPAKRRQFVDNLIRFELIAQEAARRGYGEDEEVQRVEKQMMIQRLNKELQESVRLSDITDEEMRAYYDAHQGEYHKAEMVRIARILSANEADCQKVLELARSKADDSRHFRDLALQHSTDERTKAHGGDLPYFPRTADRQEGDPEIDEALVEVSFSLEMREPLLDKCVRSSDGWNVIRLRGRRKARELSYEDVERQIRHRLHRDRLSEVRDELVTKLRKNAEIVVHDDVLAKVRIDPAPEMPEGPPGHPALFEGRGPGGPPGLAGPQGKVGPGGPGKGPRPLGPGKGPRPLGPPPPAE